MQVADTNGRHEPGTGDIDWKRIIAVLRKNDYSGQVGLEYFPTAPDGVSLAKSRLALGI